MQPRPVQDVLAYAEQLRVRRVRALDRDPWADPYAPSEAAARKVYQDALLHLRRDGNGDVEERAAAAAVQTLATRVVLREQEQQEERLRAGRAEARHARRQRHDRTEQDAARAALSLGARLDQALLGLYVISEAPVQASGERPSSPPDRTRAPSSLPADRYSLLLRDAERVVLRAEAELGHARRRELPAAVSPLLPP